MKDAKLSDNVILIDADYVDKVAFNLTVNFERMLERRIHKASLALWVDCLALDGGLRPGDNQTDVVLIHSKQKTHFDNFGPSDFADELKGKAFKDNIGEFLFGTYPVEDELIDGGEFFAQALEMYASQPEVKRLMVIPNAEDANIYNKVREALRHANPDQHITVFTMEPLPSGNFRQQILGYSLMAALGIKGEELNSKS